MPIAELTHAQIAAIVEDLVRRADVLRTSMTQRQFEDGILRIAQMIQDRMDGPLASDHIIRLAAITKFGSRALKGIAH